MLSQNKEQHNQPLLVGGDFTQVQEMVGGKHFSYPVKLSLPPALFLLQLQFKILKICPSGGFAPKRRGWPGTLSSNSLRMRCELIISIYYELDGKKEIRLGVRPLAISSSNGLMREGRVSRPRWPSRNF